MLLFVLSCQTVVIAHTIGWRTLYRELVCHGVRPRSAKVLFTFTTTRWSQDVTVLISYAFIKGSSPVRGMICLKVVVSSWRIGRGDRHGATTRLRWRRAASCDRLHQGKLRVDFCQTVAGRRAIREFIGVFK